MTKKMYQAFSRFSGRFKGHVCGQENEAGDGLGTRLMEQCSGRVASCNDGTVQSLNGRVAMMKQCNGRAATMEECNGRAATMKQCNGRAATMKQCNGRVAMMEECNGRVAT